MYATYSASKTWTPVYRYKKLHLVCPCNQLSPSAGFSDNLKQTNISKSAVKNTLYTRLKVFSVVVNSWNLKVKSWIKRSAGAYIMQLSKSDTRNIRHILAPGGRP